MQERGVIFRYVISYIKLTPHSFTQKHTQQIVDISARHAGEKRCGSGGVSKMR
jgi:hypothetical protein